MVDDGFSPEHVNVADQRHDPDSLLQFMRRLIRVYRNSAEIGWGDFAVLDQPNDAVLAHSVTGAEGQMVALHNFSSDPATVTITLPDADASTQLIGLLESAVVTLSERGSAEVALPGIWVPLVPGGATRGRSVCTDRVTVDNIPRVPSSGRGRLG